MLYSAYDLQTGRYMSTGLNSPTKQELIEDLTDYLNSDAMGDDELIEPTLENIEAAEFEIVEHEHPLEED